MINTLCCLLIGQGVGTTPGQRLLDRNVYNNDQNTISM